MLLLKAVDDVACVGWVGLTAVVSLTVCASVHVRPCLVACELLRVFRSLCPACVVLS